MTQGATGVGLEAFVMPWSTWSALVTQGGHGGQGGPTGWGKRRNAQHFSGRIFYPRSHAFNHTATVSQRMIVEVELLAECTHQSNGEMHNAARRA
jgi:hypothetical protein